MQRVNAAADEHKTLIFDELVVNCLRGNILALEIACFNRFSDFREMQRFAIAYENNVDFVADILRINGRPFREPPDVF